MEPKKLYLRTNAVVEPLIDQWYAWTHLVYPPTAAMNIVSRHLKIMNSYVQAPQIHFAAANDPKMLGGPFMNYPTLRKEEILALIAQTKDRRKNMLQLAEAINELDGMLKKNANGFSLEPLYQKVPDLLKGYVELMYDLNNNVTFRFFESLLYRSEYYDESAQSIALWLTNDDDRPFVLSTARLEEKEAITINIPFSSPIVDEIHKMRTTPVTFDHARTLLNVKEEDLELFRSLFTEEAPEPYKRYTGDKVRMRYFGHACILIETKDVSILVDPVISYYGYQSDVSRFSYRDLPDEIDYILVTHNHQDHILLETMLSLRHKTRRVIVPRTGFGRLMDPNLKLLFNAIGFDRITEIHEMETLLFGDCKITGLPFLGEHGDLDIQSKVCYNVCIQDLSILFMADSCNIEKQLYDRVAAHIDPVDVIFLGMECDGAPYSWVYDPLINGEVQRDKDRSRRLAGSDFERGKDLVDTFHPRELYVYAMGLEPWVKFISSVRFNKEAHPIIDSGKLISYCEELQIRAERLYGERELLYELTVLA